VPIPNSNTTHACISHVMHACIVHEIHAYTSPPSSQLMTAIHKTRSSRCIACVTVGLSNTSSGYTKGLAFASISACRTRPFSTALMVTGLPCVKGRALRDSRLVAQYTDFRPVLRDP
jgi:hypothetical protein